MIAEIIALFIIITVIGSFFFGLEKLMKLLIFLAVFISICIVAGFFMEIGAVLYHLAAG